jgi:ElaB/YqjD/DUF883 family membrane-anchored ribosome-binding protein
MNAMNRHTKAIRNDMGRLAEDARALVTATADVAGEGVSEARQRLASSLESGMNFADQVKEKTLEGAQATNKAVHLHPYQAMGLAFGVGAIAGVLCDLFAHRLFNRD